VIGLLSSASPRARSLLATGVVVLLVGIAGCSNKASTGFNILGSSSAVGYIDVDKVVAAHPLHDELQALEDQIAVLDAQAESEPDVVTPEQQAAQAALERDLQASEAQFETELNARQAYYRQQMQAAIAQIQSSALGGGSAPGGIVGGMRQQFGTQMQALQTAGAKTLDAYRAALYNEDTAHLRSVQQLLAADVQAKERAKASELAAKETAYQVQLAQADQDQRLNLKTELENLSLTPQQRSSDAAQLQDIETREEYLSNQLKTKDNAELAAYSESLQRDAAARFNAEKTATMKSSQAKLAARQNSLNVQFRQQATSLGSQFNQQLAQADKTLSANPKVQAQLQSVQAQTQARYEADAAQAMAAYRRTRAALVDKYSAIAHLQFQDQELIQEQIDEIAQQRHDLYDQILDQVQDQVKTVAQARGIAIVFDTVAGAGRAVDLTDQVAKAVAALPQASPSPSPSGG